MLWVNLLSFTFDTLEWIAKSILCARSPVDHVPTLYVFESTPQNNGVKLRTRQMLGHLLNSYQQTESFGIVRFAQDAKGRCPLGLQSTQRPSTQRTQQRASHTHKLLSPPKSNNTPNTCLALSRENVSHYGIVWGERSSKNCEQSSSLIGGWFCRQLARPQN